MGNRPRRTVTAEAAAVLRRHNRAVQDARILWRADTKGDFTVNRRQLRRARRHLRYAIWRQRYRVRAARR